MARDTSNRPDQPTEPVRRRPTDALWFTILFASIATGIGMTIFAPVGDEPPPAVSSTLPSTYMPTTLDSPTTGPTLTAPATTTTAPVS
jgi:hypothetical protein